MIAEILTIGDEILIGQIVNTNAVWIAQELNRLGIQVAHMASVSDSESAILEALMAASKRAQFIFITGGLGPTKDDITKKVLADFFKTKLVIDETVLADVTNFFATRNKTVTEINKNQALVPEGCKVIRNLNGTAPAMWFEENGCIFVSMPGVPYEMKALMTNDILPFIKLNFKLPFIYHKTVLTQGIGESYLAEKIEHWEDQLSKNGIKLAYLPQPGIVRLRLSSQGEDENKIKQTVELEILKLNELVSEYVFGYEEFGEETPSIQSIVVDLMVKINKTVSLAESCTGGHVAALLTSVPGVSSVFAGGLVPYSNNAKQNLLNVPTEIFEQYGAVSKECVLVMACNTLEKFKTDYSISISGVAGPSGGTPEKPVGLVWIAIASKSGAEAFSFQFGDNRSRNISMTATTALNLLRKRLIFDHPSIDIKSS
jgi:nicotinamide-nucleotide amidase